ncbi:MAG: tol-pal system protein YbgF [Deltaproteobacteria bacterium]|nr:tol-pal system protein YbgF [Deltaproteobacteria bacterium]
MSVTRLACSLIVSALLAGCWVKQEVGQRMQADIVAMQTELEVIKKAHHEEKAKLQQRLEEADKHIAELDLLIERHRKASGRNAADFGVEIEQIKSKLMELRGVVEVNQHRLEIIEKRLSIIHDDLASQKARAIEDEKERQKVQEESGKKAEQGKDPLAAIERPDEVKAFYKLAYGLLEAKQHKAARRLFEELLAKWPDSGYSDNALYWIAESHYAEGSYREAALTFQKVRAEFPKSDKAPDALLKLGYCFHAMGMYRESLPFLKEFVQSYPRNPNVGKARKKIREAQKGLEKAKSK